jgi:hypothetical protein
VHPFPRPSRRKLSPSTVRGFMSGLEVTDRPSCCCTAMARLAICGNRWRLR